MAAMFTQTTGRRTRLRTKTKSREMKMWAATAGRQRESGTAGSHLQLLDLETGMVEKTILVEQSDETCDQICKNV
jgi:hypothetical protein